MRLVVGTADGRYDITVFEDWPVEPEELLRISEVQDLLCLHIQSRRARPDSRTIHLTHAQALELAKGIVNLVRTGQKKRN